MTTGTTLQLLRGQDRQEVEETGEQVPLEKKEKGTEFMTMRGPRQCLGERRVEGTRGSHCKVTIQIWNDGELTSVAFLSSVNHMSQTVKYFLLDSSKVLIKRQYSMLEAIELTYVQNVEYLCRSQYHQTSLPPGDRHTEVEQGEGTLR